MARVLLLLPTGTYRAPDFLDAARTLGADVVVASDEPQTLGDHIVVDLCDPEAAADTIVRYADGTPLDAVVATDEAGVVAAAVASARLGLPHSPVDAVRRTRDKAALRRAFAAAGVPQAAFRVLQPGGDVAAVAAGLGFPVVLKPTAMSASRGVIRADDADAAVAAARRIRAIAGNDAAVLVESYLPGSEVAVEALLRDGSLEVLAIFDKPDPLEGPYFEETIYVQPTRLPAEVAETVARVCREAARAIGLTEGPVHAELRVDGGTAWALEVAGRSIGGLCSRTLRFGMGVSLEELILRHALGLPLPRHDARWGASGVMMLPIPRHGTLVEVRGRQDALSVPGIAGLEITVPRGSVVVPLPEGDRYLGFLFARSDTPDEVEVALRAAHARLEPVID